MRTSFSGIFRSVLLLVVFISSCTGIKEEQSSLPRSTPEAEGISSGAIVAFLDSVSASRHELHSIMILRHGKVVAEGLWHPYRSDLKHTLYSTSKSFTSTAIGFAVSEKLITVNDKVISFFPDQVPDTISTHLADMTIKDLLTMSVGHQKDPTFSIRSGDDWAKAFLALPVAYDPGTKFLYNSMATYMLAAIVQKTTGQTVLEYLTPRLFEPLGITGADWETDPKGFNTGGWGLRIKTEDMAKFGLLYLQKGSWNGKQIIPAEWIEEATTFKIDQAPEASPETKAESDWMQGYCYQFWRCRNSAFRADGAYGQYIIIMPEKDAVIAITAESPDMQDEINLVWNNILPAMKDGPIPESPSLNELLNQRLSSLSLEPVDGSGKQLVFPATQNKKYVLAPDSRLESVSFSQTDTSCRVSLKQEGREYLIDFGKGRWIESETTRPGPSLTGLPGGISRFRVAASYDLKADSTMEMILRYIESPHHEKITCRFRGDSIIMNVATSFAFGRSTDELRGRID